MASNSTRVRHAVSRSTGATTWTRKDGDEWRTTCLNHGSEATAAARGQAWKNGSTPANFCAKCKSIAAGKAEKITEGRLDIPAPKAKKAAAKKAPETAAKKAPGQEDGGGMNRRGRTLADVRALWEADADPALVQRINAMIADGDAEWAWDPWLDDVAGVVLANSNDAVIVVYPDGDGRSQSTRCPATSFVESGLYRLG